MSGSAALSTSPAWVPVEPTRLKEGQVFLGYLSDVIEPDGEDIIFPLIENCMVEVPKYLAPELQKLVGKRVVIGKFDGKYRAGRSSI